MANRLRDCRDRVAAWLNGLAWWQEWLVIAGIVALYVVLVYFGLGFIDQWRK